jgi:asparaginyl-tRNA synthetase
MSETTTQEQSSTTILEPSSTTTTTTSTSSSSSSSSPSSTSEVAKTTSTVYMKPGVAAVTQGLPTFRTYQLLPEHVDQTVCILGWIRKMRTAGKIIFMEMSAGLSQTVQLVMKKKDVPPDCLIECYVCVIGLIKKLPDGVYSALPVEVQGASMTILGPSDSSFPNICPPEAGSHTRLEQRHIYLRDPHFALVTKVRAQLLTAMRRFFDDTGVTEIVPPCFTGVEAEGGASLFKLSYPGKSSDKPITAFLTQSSQFLLEMALPGVGDCYCLYPSFRAENSNTRRHLTEFLHLEAEWSGQLTFEDHCQKLKELLDGIMTRFLVIAYHTLKELKVYDRVVSLAAMCKPDQIVILEHKDAIMELRKRGIYKDPETKEHFGERDDIPEAQERQLIDEIGKIVFLCKFPKEFKSFYMGLDPEDQTRVLGVDVECVGVGEIIGSGIREYDHDRLLQRLLECGLKPEDYTEYLQMRKFGASRSSGMGLGVDRMLTWILGVNSIRDCVSFPRFPGYLRP